MTEFEELYELADRELNAGLADEQLLERSLAEANGVDGLARQIYCEHRAKEWSRADADVNIDTVKEQVELQERRMRFRKKFNRWFWALSCIATFIATTVSSWFALSAVRSGRNFYPLASLALISFVFMVVALVASRYHTDTE